MLETIQCTIILQGNFADDIELYMTISRNKWKNLLLRTTIC